MFGSTPSLAQAVLERPRLPVLASWKPSGIYSVLFSVYLEGVGVPGPTTFPLYFSVWYIPSGRQLGGRLDKQGMKSEVARLAPGPYHHLTQCS